MSFIARHLILITVALVMAFSVHGYAEEAAPVNLSDYQGVIKVANEVQAIINAHPAEVCTRFSKR